MYVPPPYREERRDVLLGAVHARSFGTLVSGGAGGLRLSHVPFGVLDEGGEPVLIAHLARANPQWRDLDEGGEVVASFLVDDAYISPGWYPTKRETGRVVPTWNYIAVEARGPAQTVEDRAGLLALVDSLTGRHEAGRAAPWATADAPRAYTDALLGAIVGVRIRVTSLTGAWKLDQKKPATDRAGAALGLVAEDRGALVREMMAQLKA